MSLDSQDSPRPLGEISQGPSAFEQFLDRNQKNLVILSIAIAVAIAAWLVYQGIAKSKEHSAGAELCKAADLPALQALTEKYRGTAAAGTAAVPLAERQWTENQADAAITTLKTFIAANPKHPARPAAQASLGSKLKAQGNLPEAKKLFQELADDPAAAYLAPYALITLGDLARTAGETDPAEKFYQKAKADFPGNSFGMTIDQRLALLKAKLPAEIDPPPAPPAPAPGAPSTAPGSIPGATPPGIPGLPPSGQEPPEADVPPVNNPFINPPTPPPSETPAPEPPPVAPPAAGATPPQESPAPARSEPAPPAAP